VALEDAVVGGIIGAASAGVIALMVRAVAIPSEARAHDRFVGDRDEDLARWISDEHVRLAREIRTIGSNLNARNLFYSGELGYQVGLAKERALHAYRDQETQARRDAAAVHDRETMLHRIYRGLRRQPFRDLETPVRATPVLDLWREPVTRHLQPSDRPAEVDDPAARTLDVLLTKLDTERGRFT
jgi:hypothetical protein